MERTEKEEITKKEEKNTMKEGEKEVLMVRMEHMTGRISVVKEAEAEKEVPIIEAEKETSTTEAETDTTKTRNTETDPEASPKTETPEDQEKFSNVPN